MQSDDMTAGVINKGELRATLTFHAHAGGLELRRVQTERGEYFKKALLRVAGQIRSLDLDAFRHRDGLNDGRFSGIQWKIQSRRINIMHAKNG